MVKSKKPAIRKPRDLSFGKDYIASVCEDYHYDGREIEEGIDLLNRDISTKEARKIAEFLLKAANYIEQSTRKKSI